MKDLWTLALDELQVDPDDLVQAIEDQVRRDDLDYRSRLLIRDSVQALEKHWGKDRLARWLTVSPYRQRIDSICGEDFERPGFRFLSRRIMEVTRPEHIRQFLRELSTSVHRPVTLYVGGSAALILPGLLYRRTHDIDVVDEVPAELRTQHTLLDQLAKSYALELTHFQSHHLPAGWQNRLHSEAPLGRLNVYLVDPYDVFLSKLFSAREKDRDDLRVVAPKLEKDVIVRKLKDHAQRLLAVPDLKEKAERNWLHLYGEPLPT